MRRRGLHSQFGVVTRDEDVVEHDVVVFVATDADEFRGGVAHRCQRPYGHPTAPAGRIVAEHDRESVIGMSEVRDKRPLDHPFPHPHPVDEDAVTAAGIADQPAPLLVQELGVVP